MTKDSLAPSGGSPAGLGPWGLRLELGGEGWGGRELRTPRGDRGGEVAPGPSLVALDSELDGGGRGGRGGPGEAAGGLLQGLGRGGGEAEPSFLPTSFPALSVSSSSSSSSSKGFLPAQLLVLELALKGLRGGRGGVAGDWTGGAAGFSTLAVGGGGALRRLLERKRLFVSLPLSSSSSKKGFSEQGFGLGEGLEMGGASVSVSESRKGFVLRGFGEGGAAADAGKLISTSPLPLLDDGGRALEMRGEGGRAGGEGLGGGRAEEPLDRSLRGDRGVGPGGCGGVVLEGRESEGPLALAESTS